ncbi:hypothetical protein L1987_53991 [Smallanthus sonchifolius]|uniref:Uncharacterized protein n=1 Tax=Smallanthus sonchifolius TaxID=185202 RepID=A0ACB9E6U5_9ASTR|nr:hypothetical protein L1987_53991 [Smallanthus sonchifolius]
MLSLLEDSADVARCRVASKAFNTVLPGLRSINQKQHINSRSRVSVFLNLISKLETVESVCHNLVNLKLALGSRKKAPRYATCSKFTLRKAFTVFPNMSSLCIKSSAWPELEACLNSEDWDILDGKKGLKTFCAYVTLVDQSLVFSSLTCVLDQCVRLSDVSLLILRKDFGPISESFMSKCMARWPRLKWRWGKWSERKISDSWITNISNLSPQII